MHCWLPLHIWLDKGLVTSHVKMFPIVLRALWLPSEIRNASGNGGGVIIGFMIMVEDPASKLRFNQFKREIYQQVMEKLFETIWKKSWFGEPVRCGDDEAWSFTCCRANRAKHPCPRCLVSHEMLDCLHQFFPLRSSEAMRNVVERARCAPTAAQRDKLLMDHGLHDVPHFMWNIRFSDPYLSFIYDLLHFLEAGKWGHHLWSLTLDLLEKLGLLAEVTKRMAKFSRWRNLKHINDLATKDFTDGQTHLDISQGQSFVWANCLFSPQNRIPCIRALLKCRIIVVQQCIEDYEKWCKVRPPFYIKLELLTSSI
ncbi:hypothetical protein R3P38DRAFT_2934234 [Favolaschia claudopus]|uniref:Uncharacterized protein n=1 Tax=Favolaschia claudopus TaxID=2862362 RepID=A0AAW0BSI5_9AGAR